MTAQATHNSHDTPADLIGWSRGCFEAVRTANLIAGGIRDLAHPQRILRQVPDMRGKLHPVWSTSYLTFSPPIRFVGLISPVNQLGPNDWIHGNWPRSLPAGVQMLYEARDNAPDDWLFTETEITAAAGTTVDELGYVYLDHPHIGYSPLVLSRMEADARSVGVQF